MYTDSQNLFHPGPDREGPVTVTVTTASGNHLHYATMCTLLYIIYLYPEGKGSLKDPMETDLHIKTFMFTLQYRHVVTH